MSSLLEEGQCNSCKISTTPPGRIAVTVCLSWDWQRHFRFPRSGIVVYLGRITNITNRATQITGYFCYDTVLNLSDTVLTDIEIKILEKGLDFAPIQRKMNEPELRQNFAKFCRQMRTKWFFKDEPTLQFS